MTEDIFQQIEEIKRKLLEQQKANSQNTTKEDKKIMSKKKVQLSVSSFVFIAIITLYIVLSLCSIYADFFVLPKIEADTDAVRRVSKLSTNINYTIKDFMTMVTSACVAWMFRGKIEEKEKQALEEQIKALTTQKDNNNKYDLCGKDL